MLKSNFRHSLFTDTFSNFRVNFEKKFAKIFSFFLMPKDEIDNVVGKKFLPALIFWLIKLKLLIIQAKYFCPYTLLIKSILPRAQR